MNLLKQWFGRHPRAPKHTHEEVTWTGASGKRYGYWVYPIRATFRPMPGNFIYARQEEDGSWLPIYIAQTRDMHQRLEGHVGVETAMEHGATHLHAHFDTSGQSARCKEERDLIMRWQPPCNDF